MFHTIKTLLICLAVFAIGSVQLFGVQVGYLCECTGEHSAKVSCETAGCHEDEAPATVCGHAEGQCQDAAPAGQDHQHSEVRDSLAMTGLPMTVSLPSPVFFDLPPSFQVVEFTMEIQSSLLMPDEDDALEDRSPPAALMVAKTTVLLV